MDMSIKTSVTNSIDEHIGRRIQLRRTMMGMSQKDLAEIFASSEYAVSLYQQSVIPSLITH